MQSARFRAACDIIRRDKLVEALKEYKIPQTLIRLYNYYSNKMHTFFIIKITRYYNL
jgi:hypothetical protein